MPNSTNRSTLHLNHKNRLIILVIGVMLIAANLRAPVTGIAPLLDLISESFGLTATQAGMLTTLPLIGFALFAPPSSYLTKKIGLEYTVFIALILIGSGLLLRSAGSVSALFIGTAVIGIGVSIGNVLLPIIVKRDFPTKVAVMTSSYVLAMGVVSALASAFSIPLATDYQLGWQGASAALSLVTLVAMLVWLPQLRYNSKPTDVVSQTKPTNLWTRALAWQVSLYLGLGSFFTYTLVAWIPSILVQTGFSAEEAGIIHAIFQIGTALPGIFIIPLMARLDDQRLFAFSVCIIAAICTVGLLYFPQFSYIWSFFLGLCSGTWFILGIAFISLRTSSTLMTTTLSGMAQFIGYTLAAIGPMVAGYLYGFNHEWSGVILMIVLVCATSACIGLMAGRKVVIE